MIGLLVTLIVLLAAACAASLVLARIIEARRPPLGAFVVTDSGRIHLYDTPPAELQADDAPAVLLLHGANLCVDDMRVALGDALAARFRVFAPDRPGQGYSDLRTASDLSPARQVEILRQAVLARNIGPVILVGHSLGGLIALRYALDNPDDIAGLVLINATTHPRPGGLPWYQQAAQVVAGPIMSYTLLPVWLAMLDRIGGWLFTPEAPPPNYATRSRLALGLTPKRFLASLREYAALRENMIEHAPRYPEITTPTTIVMGEADRIAPPQVHGELLGKAIPHARLVRLAGAGHMAHHAYAATIAEEIERIATLPRAAMPAARVPAPD